MGTFAKIGKMKTALILTLCINFALARNPFSMKELEVDDTHPCRAENLKLAVSYYCDDTGKWYCQNGWKSPDNETEGTQVHDDNQNPCSVPVCDPECEHGYCADPNVCACHVGWEGHQCNKCIKLGGCLHGGCETALECNCTLGSNVSLRGKYTGTHCDIPKCTDKCVHGVCDEPDKCRCENGWTGKTCNECVALSGCKHGGCTDKTGKSMPNTCKCKLGWSGPLCDEPVCAEGCDEINGHCNEPGECLCNVGWKGESCNECVPLWDCPNQKSDACIKPNDCFCDKSNTDYRCSVAPTNNATEKPATEKPTTEKPATEKSTTEKPATEQPTTTETA